MAYKADNKDALQPICRIQTHALSFIPVGTPDMDAFLCFMSPLLLSTVRTPSLDTIAMHTVPLTGALFLVVCLGPTIRGGDASLRIIIMGHVNKRQYK